MKQADLKVGKRWMGPALGLVASFAWAATAPAAQTAPKKAEEAATARAAAVTGPMDEDLAVVQRATMRQPEVQESPRPVVRKGAKPQWFKVRVVEKGRKRGRVSINLPLALVRALGDDLPIDFHCRQGHRDRDETREGRCSIRLAEVLEALDTGQDLVEIEDEEATVRIWVE